MKKRNLFKKSLSVMLALLMVLSTLVIIPMASADETDDLPEAWDGMTFDYSWYKADGAGTADKPYEIATAAQLAAWSALSNGTYTPADIGEETATHKVFNDKYFVLTNDINMGGNPILPIVGGFTDANAVWYDDYGKALNFDGQNYTIFNLKINAMPAAYTITVGESTVTMVSNTTGFFATLGADSVIKNINFVGADVSCSESGWNNAGLLVGYISGDNVLVENIIVDETSKVDTYRITGGLVSCVADKNVRDAYRDITFKNCAVFATIKGTGARLGGIAGSATKMGGTINFENCVFGGTMNMTSNATGGVSTGAIFGVSLDFAVTLNFENCVNFGVIQTKEGETHSKAYDAVGGIAGGCNRNAIFTLTNCYDLGTYAFNTSAAVTQNAVTPKGAAAGSYTEYSYAVAQDGVTYTDAENVVPSLNTIVEVAPFTYSSIYEEILDIMTVFTGVNLKDAILDLIAWDGMTFDYSWYKVSGAGTAEKPYEIDSAAALAGWSALSNGTYNAPDLNETEATAKVFNDKYFVLTADINMGGNPILPITAGKWASNPSGDQIWDKAAGSGLTFDGQGYTIYNLSINSKNSTHDGQALFGSIGPNTTIKNLKFVGATVGKGVGGWQPTAIVAAYATGDGIVLENIFIDDTCFIDGNHISGGLVGYMLDREAKTMNPVSIKNCVVNATIQCTGVRSAGLVGCHIVKNGTLNFENCVFGGNFVIEKAANTNTALAGICGITMDVDTTMTFKNCINAGNFYNVEGTTSDKPVYIAGISCPTNPGKGVQTQTFENCFDMSTKSVDSSTGTVVYYVLTYTIYEFTATNCGGLANDAEHKDTDYVIDALTPEIEAQLDALSAALLFEYVAFNGEGTEASPLVIATAEDLYKYAVNYNLFTEKTYITVADDIEVGDYLFDPIAATVEVVVTADNKTITFPCTVADPAKAIFAEGVSASVTGITPVVADHDFEFKCSAECAVCGKANTEAAAHTTDGACDLACNVCGAATGNTAAHTYDHNCDADCNVCGEGREVDGHAYDGACDEECNNCGTPNAGATAHLWENDCDAECNVCGKDRDAGHTYDGDCDTSCNGCGEARMDTAAHTYDNDQDASCNVCGATRKVTTPDTPAGDKPADDKDETTAAADEETTAKETVKADTTEPTADEGCASSVAGIGALLALTASFGFALVGKKKED